ncbi:hypothetical protein SS50377_26104 [Spironucleus salmonicida]|uniref:Uncharacterized protein n=1 Tax=Spironucleus salmonicida TaxID=348837 RepID=V6M474_9EUKA|nr:hypothetical protein SS50377_26104 [Spironucleus salmonicida]|eukprot:EST48129.1 Hypothetical protein SS50377_11729 [Spironucleus salmonicida]
MANEKAMTGLERYREKQRALKASRLANLKKGRENAKAGKTVAKAPVKKSLKK